MYKTVVETVKYVKEFRSLVKDFTGVEIVIAPPFTAIHAAAEAARASNVAIAAQDLYWEREGAFTGEVGASMVREAGAEYVIIGHSERRTLFGETDSSVNRKTHAAPKRPRRTTRSWPWIGSLDLGCFARAVSNCPPWCCHANVESPLMPVCVNRLLARRTRPSKVSRTVNRCRTIG